MDEPLVSVMTITDDGEPEEIGDITFCEMHETEIRMALIERGFGADCELTSEERGDALMAGRPDALLTIKNRLVMGALQTFGGATVVHFKGCPVCAFTGVIEQAADGVANERTRKN